MEFLNRMKKRDMIEIGLMAGIAILTCMIVIFFLEFMIYNIFMDKIQNNNNAAGQTTELELFVEEDNNLYMIYKHYTDTDMWIVQPKNITKEQVDNLFKSAGEMYSYNVQLEKIVVSKTGEADVEYTVGVNNESPESQVRTIYAENNEEYTFTIKTRTEVGSDEWTVKHENLTYENLIKLYEAPGEYANTKTHWRTPNCFDIYMNGTHYIVMAVVLLVVAGVFVWRGFMINKEYKKLYSKLKRTGKIF